MKLVDRVAEYIASRLRIDNGAADFSHLMVVVPTAQAGRTLRRRLAERYSPRAILPPKVVSSFSLCRPAIGPEGLRAASDAEIDACWTKWSRSFRPRLQSALEQFIDIWRILAGNGLAIEDVQCAEEAERWERLKEIERSFFAFLNARGLYYPTMSMRAAKCNPAAIDEGIVELVIPPVLDPPRVFWQVVAAQRPELKVTRLPALAQNGLDNLRDQDILVFGDCNALSESCPAGNLSVTDPELFPDIEASLMNRGFEVRNPEPHLLLASSLGREVREIMRSCPPGRDLADFVRTELSARYVGKGPFNREFLAAAESTRSLLDELGSPVVKSLGLAPAEMLDVALRRLAAANYQLEPEREDALIPEGWLELAWSEADTLEIAGFHEGVVPESVVGHGYLPDSLRRELGLVANDDRLARDRAILNEVLAARAPGAVRIYLARANANGDLKKPSRLLFEVPDGRLVERVKRVFGEDCRAAPYVKSAIEPRFPASVPAPKRLSPSAIGDYIRSPKLYLLRRVLKMEPVRDESELDALAFGTLAHEVLKKYADEQILRGDAQLTSPGDIRDRIAVFMREVRSGYANAELAVRLQLDALEARLMQFAEVQSQLARDGWRIARAEYGFSARPWAEFDVDIFGIADRIDVHPEFGERIIDYKTWAKYERRKAHNVQLPLYGLCYGGKTARLAHFVLGDEPGNVKLVEMDPEDADALLEKVPDAIRGILAGDFDSPGEEPDAWEEAIS